MNADDGLAAGLRAAEEARQASAPGGPLEFAQAGGRIEVPNGRLSSFDAQVSGAMVMACDHGRPTLLDGPNGREAVLISHARYLELVGAVSAATRIAGEAATRLAELAGAHGCEAAAEIARMEGRRDAAGEITGHRQRDEAQS